MTNHCLYRRLVNTEASTVGTVVPTYWGLRERLTWTRDSGLGTRHKNRTASCPCVNDSASAVDRNHETYVGRGFVPDDYGSQLAEIPDASTVGREGPTYAGSGHPGYRARRILVVVSAIILAGLSLSALASDFTGCPEKLASLSPAVTEMVYAAGAGECLAGVVEWSDWPPEAKELPRIGDAFQFDLERMLGLGVDRALAWRTGTPEAAVRRIRELGIEVTWMEVSRIDDIAESILQIGNLAGTEDTARHAATTFRADMQKLREQYGDREPVGIFYQISRQPLYTLGSQHVISEVIELCGGRNVFSDLDRAAATIGIEAVLARDPDVIVAGTGTGPASPLDHWREHESLSAVRNGQLHAIDAETLVRPGPRLPDGAGRLCRVLDQSRSAQQR